MIARTTVDGVIAVIDAPAVAAGRFAADPAAIEGGSRRRSGFLVHDEPLQELFADQLACADMVVLNKTDGLDARLLAKISAQLRCVCSAGDEGGAVGARRHPRVVLGLDAQRWKARSTPAGSHHDAEEGEHDHEFVSFVADLGPVADLLALERRIRAVTAEHDVLRVKGFLHVPGKAMRHVVQCVGTRLERYFDRPWRPDELPRSHLVVIGQKGMDAAAVRLALQG